MTVPVQDTFTAAIANGLTTVFPYGFKITDAADLEVSLDGVVTTIGFTVSGVGESSGNVTFSVAPANGTKVLLSLNPILRRTTDIQQFGDWMASVVNKEFDRIWLALQKQKQNDTRSIKMPIDTPTDQSIIEDAAGRARKLIGFDALGNIILYAAQVGTSLIDLAASTGASLVGFLQAGVGAVQRTLQDKVRDIVSVKDFGAVADGVTPCHDAFMAALAASNNVFVPAGTYNIEKTLAITGDKTLSGPPGSSSSQQAAVLQFTGTGSVITAVSAEYGGVCIRNFKITGGGNGNPAVYNTRPQSVFENLHIEGYDGGGVTLEEAGTGNQASWGTLVRQVKWIGPATASSYRGFVAKINGGHVTFDGCEAIRGAIGLEILQGQAINVYRCSFNLQCNTTTYPYASTARDYQCAIRLTGTAYKQAVNIHDCYIEGFTYGIYAEAVESLSIENNFIADLGVNSDFVGTPGSDIHLRDDGGATGRLTNVTIKNNNIRGTGNGASTIYIGNNVEKVYLENNCVTASGGPPASYCVAKGTGGASYLKGNKFTFNAGAGGTALYDPNRLLVSLDPNGPSFSASGTFTVANSGNGTQAAMATEAFDTSGAYSTSTYKFLPSVAGYYLITGEIDFPSALTGTLVGGGIAKNATDDLGQIARSVHGVSAGFVNVSLSTLVFLNGTSDYVALYAIQNSGAPIASVVGRMHGFLARGA